MRVITGIARGKRLKTLEGLDVRPTSDKVKEAIFSIIQFDLPSASVLDLFAGCGQLGIEAISRGAEHCVFVDKSRQSVAVIRENVQSCGFVSQSRILNMDAIDYLRSAKPGIDIALLDPPYEQGLVLKALPLLEPKLSDRAIVVCEHESDLELPDEIGRLKKYREYNYGKKIALTTFVTESEGDENE